METVPGTLLETVRWFFVTSVELAVLFLGISFLIGLLRAWGTEQKVRRLFEGRGVTGYLAGALLGTVTPFCSYSTIPVLAGLLRSRAPFGPTMAFLFASPLLDPIVLGVLVFVVGIWGTAVYAAVTFLGAVAIGVLFARLGFESDVKDTVVPCYQPDGDRTKGSAWSRAWGEAWGFFMPVLPHLLVGTAAGALVYGFVPTAWILALAGPEQPLSIPVAAALGVPVYVNAETFFPIAGALLQKGMGVGAVVALIITSMGVSIPEVSLLSGIFRPRLVIALVIGVFAVAIIGGTVFALIP